MKKFKRIVSIFVLILLLFITGCGFESTFSKKEEFLVRFELNNGEESSECLFIENTELVYEEDLEYYGYTFDGWYFDEELTNPLPEDYKVSSNIVVYAKWSIREYNITCYNGKEIVQVLSAKHNSLLERPNSPVKEGYTLVGWTKIKDGTKLYDFEKEIVDKDFNLFAVWEANPFTITYDIGYKCYTSKKELYNDFFTDFYNFLVEKTDANLSKYNVNSLNDFLVFCANWNANGSDSFYGVGNAFSKYFVTIEIGGTLENQPDSTFIGYCYQNNKYVDFIPFLMTFFAYWRTDEGYTGSSSDPNNTGNDFFASAWASLVDTCKFFHFTSQNLNDTYPWFTSKRVKDALDNVPGVVNITQTSGYSDSPITLPSIKRPGYEFLGWYDSLEENAKKITTVNVTMTVYAKWKKVE